MWQKRVNKVTIASATMTNDDMSTIAEAIISDVKKLSNKKQQNSCKQKALNLHTLKCEYS